MSTPQSTAAYHPGKSIGPKNTQALKGIFAHIHAHDPEMAAHGLRVGEYAGALARHIGLSSSDSEQISIAAAIHDVGKTGTLAKAWNSSGPLPHATMVRHTVDGEYMLQQQLRGPFGHMASETAFMHHERMDGNGYHGYRGEDIPLAVRIVAIADTFDAMTTNRSYQAAMSPEAALRRMQEAPELEGAFDPELLEAFGEIAVEKFRTLHGRDTLAPAPAATEARPGLRAG